MSHDLHIDSGVSKDEIYAQLLPQLTALTEGESDMIACMANLCAALHQTFGWLWTGFYRAKGDELVLGPFQGPLACVRIKRGKGVCGTAWIKEETIVVPDVEKFPGHIACSSLSRSEIVVPIKKFLRRDNRCAGYRFRADRHIRRHRCPLARKGRRPTLQMPINNQNKT